MTYEQERDEREIRRRAAWLLGMLAVVAVLVVVVFVFLLGGSGGGGGNNQAAPVSSYPTAPSTSDAPSSGGRKHASGGSGSPSTSTSATTATSSGSVPKASCPSQSTCNVKGDIGGALVAINKLRSQNGLSAVQASISDTAQQCAITSGSDCPQSFVWVHVDDLSGSSVVSSVEGFNGSDNLLDAGATKFEIGWAFDPGSQSTSCAVISVS